MLEIKNLHVSYGRHHVLDDICLKIKNGETFGLIGLNGAGKTTLIKTILGLRQSAQGSVSFANNDNKELSVQDAKKLISYLPERFDPPYFLSAYEFIKFSASLYKITPAREKIIEAAENLELNPDVLKNSVNTFSKGMRQKLGLIATILTECRFLILDEPMSGLDPKARVCVKDNIMRLRGEGRTVFLSSHILSDLGEICDHVAVLHDKSIRYDGPPQGLMDQFKSKSLERAFLESIKNKKNAA